MRCISIGRVCLGICLAGAAMLGIVPASAAVFVVSEQGRPACVITVGDAAPEVRLVLADDLARWLRQITGAAVPVRADADARRIVLALADEAPEGAPVEGLADLGPEGFVVRSTERRLWLLARTDLGLQHAVYALLEHVGCRWFFPDPVWTVVPTTPDLTVDVRLRAAPAFRFRRIWYGWGHRTKTLREDHEAWYRHNRQLGGFRTDCGHAYERYVPRRLFNEHPEWFALVDGKRKPAQLCVTHPEVQRRVIDGVLAAFRKDPSRTMCSVEPNDGGGYCRCERCRALGSPSDGVFHLANVVAKAVRERYPDKWVGLYAYAHHSEPPDFPIEPGVYVQVTTGFRYTDMSFDEQVRTFRQRGATLGVYDYFSVYPWDYDMPGRAKAGRVYQLADAVRRYRDLGLTTYDAESSCNWGPNGLGYWMASHLMWDPDRDPEALVTDFCTRAFGRGAGPMRRMYERWAKGRRFSPRGLRLALLDLGEARHLARDDGDAGVRARLDRVAMYLHWLRLWTEYDRAARWNQWNKLVVASPREIIERARRVVTYAGRLTDTGLIHVHPMLHTDWFKRRFAALGRIDGFDFAETDAWKTARTDIPTAEEAARVFGNDLACTADWPAVEIDGRTFSRDLVPLAERAPDAVRAWGDVSRSPLGVEDGVHYITGRKGETLRLPYTPFDKGHTVDCHWTLTRVGAAAPAAEGDVKAPKGEAAAVEVTLPSGGLFAFDPGTDYWKAAEIGFGPRPLVVWAGRADAPGEPKRTPLRLWRPRAGQPLYFFVPKGTRHFVVGIASGGDPFTKLLLRAPPSAETAGDAAAGDAAARQAASPTPVLADERVLAGDQVAVSVPAGADGAVWSLSLDSLRCVVELYDVPPYLARRPADLLVPADALGAGRPAADGSAAPVPAPSPVPGTQETSDAPSTAPAVTLAEGRRARQAVIVAAGASEATRAAAAELAEVLGRIASAPFEVRPGDGTQGIAVGVAGDFPAVRHGVRFDPDDPFRRDDYLLRTHAGGVYVIGAGETAVGLAVWDLLHRLGYRLYFLTDTWEIVPDRPDLRIAVDTVGRPDFVTRAAPRGAPWSDRDLWDRWRRRNRVISSFTLHTGHSYGGIIRANREAFAAHPEFYALVDGERRLAGQTDGRGNIKFCISNPGLRRLVADHAVRTVKADPDRDSISMDPSDGGHWCECAKCKAMGSVSDRVVRLAGEVAEAINGLRLGPKYVGIYAYSQHSPPPHVKVPPRVIVSIATSFIRGGYTLEELIEGWSARGATLGIRDYHDVFTWSHDLPRKARGGDLAYLREKIPYFYRHGARFMNSENADSWGANGLGYWITPRLLWDVAAAGRIDDLVEDFLDHAFGPAKAPMRRFYHLLNRDKTIRSSEDVVARMYRCLDEARGRTDDAAVLRRLDDLILYTRYLELYYDYRAAEGDARQQGFERLWRHVYRIRDRRMVSTRAICQRDRFRDDAVRVPEAAAWDVPEEKNPWKSGRPFAADEIAAILAAGIEANEPTRLDVKAVAYSEDLVPAAPLNLPEVEPTPRPERFRGRHRVWTWLAGDPAKAPGDQAAGGHRLALQVTGGLIAHYRDRGHVRIALHAAGDEAAPERVDHDESVPPDGQPRKVLLRSPRTGLHVLAWRDGRDMTRLALPETVPLTFRSSLDDPLETVGRWSLYFYVPRGTRTVGGYATHPSGRLVDARGRTALAFDGMDRAGYFSVAVPEGQDGRLWKFEHCAGSRMLMTVPPYLAARPADLLLPREVVAADAPDR